MTDASPPSIPLALRAKPPAELDTSSTVFCWKTRTDHLPLNERSVDLCSSAIDHIHKLKRHLRRNICGVQDRTTSSNAIRRAKMVSTMPPGVKEASISWVPQLIRGKAVFLADACLQKLVASFLATNFLNWLEVCSIIGMVPHAFHELRRLEDLLSSDGSADPTLTYFVINAVRLIDFNSGVMGNYPLQMYDSVLETIPRHSRFAQYFAQQLAYLDSRPASDAEQPWSRRVLDVNYGEFCEEALEFSPGGQTLVWAGDWYVKSFCTKTGRRLFSPSLAHADGFAIRSIRFLENGVPIAAAQVGRSIFVKDMETWEILVVLRNCLPDNGTAELSPDGQLIALGTLTGRVTVWKLFDEGGATSIFSMQRAGCNISYGFISGDNQTLVCTGLDRYYCVHLDTYDLVRRTKRFMRKAVLMQCQFSHDSQAMSYTAATGIAEGDKRIEIVHTESGKTRFTIPGKVLASAFSPDGKLFAYFQRDSGLFLCSAADGSGAIQLPLPGGDVKEWDADKIRFSPQGDRLACLHSNRKVTLWRL